MRVRLLQWNVWFKEDPQRIVEVIKRLNPDVCCLQELTIHRERGLDMPQSIAAGLGDTYSHVFAEAQSWLEPGRSESIGNGVFTRLPIIGSRQRFLNPPAEDPEHHSYQGRVYLEAQMKAVETLLTVGVTHLSYAPGWAGLRAEEDALLEEIGDRRYLLALDPNVLPTHRLISELGRHLQSAGPPYNQATWTTKPQTFPEGTRDTLDWRLDYVFASRDLKVVGAEIIRTDVSDHLPILVEVTSNG